MPNPIAPDHIYELTTVSDPSLSPDGTRLAFTRSNIDRERMESRSQVMMMDLPDGAPFAFTQGDVDSTPRFSPDGQAVAFVRRDDSGVKQLWLIPVAGGEARQLTHGTGGAAEHAWSGDSRSLAFTSDVDPDRVPEDHDHNKEPQVRVARRIRYRTDSMGWRGDRFRQLFVVNAHTRETRQLTHGEGEVAAPVWSPDGSRIAFVSDRRADRDVSWHAEVYVVPAEGGALEEWSRGLSCYSQGGVDGALAWSPDGGRLAVVGTDDDEVSDSRQSWLFVVEPGQQPIRLTDGEFTPLLPTSEVSWASDGRILFLADRRGESYLCRVSPNGGGFELVSGGNVRYAAVTLDAEAGKAVVVADSPATSGDLHLVDTTTRTDTKLTDYNDLYFAQHPPARLEKSTLERAGMQIESRILFPPDFDRARRYPMVVDIHGGPHGRFSDSFDARQQVLATAGYIVLAVNPRGSSSYGPEFAKAVLGDWGGEDYLDIMAAVDEMCTKPYIDSDRLGVNGYSYGGYMSSWIVGHSTRFSAAVVGAPCINLSSMYGTSDIGVSFGETH